MQDEGIPLLPAVQTVHFPVIRVSVRVIIGVVSADMGPSVQSFGGFLHGYTGLAGKQVLNIVFRDFGDRGHKLLTVHAVQQKLLFLILQLSLRISRSGIKDHGQVDVLRLFIAGKQEAVVLHPVEVILHILKSFCVEPGQSLVFLCSCQALLSGGVLGRGGCLTCPGRVLPRRSRLSGSLSASVRFLCAGWRGKQIVALLSGIPGGGGVLPEQRGILRFPGARFRPAGTEQTGQDRRESYGLSYFLFHIILS